MNSSSQKNVRIEFSKTQNSLTYKPKTLQNLERFNRRRIAITHGTVSYIDPDWRNILAQYEINAEQLWPTPQNDELVTTSEHSMVHRVLAENSSSYYIKNYRYSTKDGTRYFLRPTRAAGEVFGLTELNRLSIPTAKVIGFQEQREFGIPRSAVLITESIDNVVSLATYAKDIWQHLSSKKRNRILLILQNDILDKLNTIHKASFFHRDLYWKNILVDPDNIERGTIWIDAPGARYQRLQKSYGRLVDLATLGKLSLSYMTKSERLSFLKQYLDITGFSENIQQLYSVIGQRHRNARRPPKIISRPRR